MFRRRWGRNLLQPRKPRAGRKARNPGSLVLLPGCHLSQDMSLDRLLSLWRNDPETAQAVSVWQTTSPRPADLRPFPADLPAALAQALAEHGISSLFRHQVEAWEA